MVIMESYYPEDQIRELWLKIEQLHLGYLEMEENSEKILQRNKLEDCIAEFLCIVSHKHKFVFSETEEVFYRSAAYKKDFSGYKAATGWNALQMYAANLLTQPWRKEYRQIKTYCGFYKHQIEANLIGAEKIFEIMGYRHIGNGILALDGPVCPDRVANISRDCLVAYVECQILKHMWEEVSVVFNISWLETLEYRRNYCGSPSQCIKNLKYKFHSKHALDPARNLRTDNFENNYHPVSPTSLSMPPSQMSTPISHNFMPPPSHNHVSLPVQTVPYCLPHTNGCPNAYSTYGYAPYAGHLPVVKQALPAVVIPNGYYYTNGYPLAAPAYPVPTGQLIEIESRNGYDMVDGASTSLRVRKPRTESSVTVENDRVNRIQEISKNGLDVKDEKQASEEDWGYVYKNLEKQGYSKDLGERGDILGLAVSDKQRRPTKEIKKVRSTNLDEALNSLAVNDRPLKMTEALERMEQRPIEKVSQPKERRHSQGSSYENVTHNEGIKTVKPSLKPTSSVASQSQSKSTMKEKSDKENSKGSFSLDTKKSKIKEPAESSKWQCKSCTFINTTSNDICEMCSKSKNIGQEQPMEVGGAECSKCTLVNPRSAKACQACNSSLKDSPTYI